MSVGEKITPEEEKESQGNNMQEREREDVRADATRERIHKCDDCTHGVRRQTRNKHNKKNRRQVPKIPSPRMDGMELWKGCFCRIGLRSGINEIGQKSALEVVRGHDCEGLGMGEVRLSWRDECG